MVSVIAAGIFAAPAAGASGTWSTSLPKADLTSTDAGGGIYVDSARVWWLSGDELHSRPLTGRGTTRRTKLQYPASTDPLLRRFGALRFVVADGSVLIAGKWLGDAPEQGSGETTDASPNTVTLTFDRDTGVLDRSTTYAPGTAQVAFGPVPVTLRRGSDGVPLPALNAVTGKTLAPLTAGFKATAAGSSFLAYEGSTDLYNNDWTDGKGNAVVRDLGTGEARYRVTSGHIRRAAGAPKAATTEIQLQPNGTLAPSLLHSAGMRARPTFVDARGRAYAIGNRISGVTALKTVSAGNRVLVQVSRKQSPKRSCDALWLGAVDGSRWRRITAPSANAVDVVSWTSRHLVLRIEPRRGPDVLKVVRAPSALALSKTHKPTCPAS